MFLTMIWGGYMIFFAGSSKTAGEKNDQPGTEALNQFVLEVVGKLAQSELTETEKYKNQKASSMWQKDPFLKSDTPLKDVLPPVIAETEKTDGNAGFSFIYSGYMAIGDRKIAILNDIEYEEGDALELDDYYLRRIYSNRVVIGRVSKKLTFTVPLVESVTTSN